MESAPQRSRGVPDRFHPRRERRNWLRHAPSFCFFRHYSGKSLKPSEIPLHQSCRCFLMASLLFRFCQPVNRTSPAEIPPAFVTSPAPLRILRNHHIRYVYCIPCIPSLFFPLYIPCANRSCVSPLLLPRTPVLRNSTPGLLSSCPDGRSFSVISGPLIIYQQINSMTASASMISAKPG